MATAVTFSARADGYIGPYAVRFFVGGDVPIAPQSALYILWAKAICPLQKLNAAALFARPATAIPRAFHHRQGKTQNKLTGGSMLPFVKTHSGLHIRNALLGRFSVIVRALEKRRDDFMAYQIKQAICSGCHACELVRGRFSK